MAKESTNPAPIWFWPSGLLLMVGMLICLILLLVDLGNISNPLSTTASLPNSTGQITIAAPTAKTYVPNATQYCTYIGDLNNQQLGPVGTFGATLLVNSAPTSASHHAAENLYKYVVKHKTASPAQVSAVNAAYTCPSTTSTTSN